MWFLIYNYQHSPHTPTSGEGSEGTSRASGWNSLPPSGSLGASLPLSASLGASLPLSGSLGASLRLSGSLGACLPPPSSVRAKLLLARWLVSSGLSLSEGARAGAVG